MKTRLAYAPPGSASISNLDPFFGPNTPALPNAEPLPDPNGTRPSPPTRTIRNRYANFKKIERIATAGIAPQIRFTPGESKWQYQDKPICTVRY